MDKSLQVGIIQHCASENIAENRSRISSAARNLAGHGARLIVNQELHDSLYFCQTENPSPFDIAVSLEPDSEAVNFYSHLARETGAVLVTSLFERRAPGLYHNTAVVFEKDGSVAGKYRKMHIPDDPAYYEKYYFTPGDIGFEPVDTSVGRLGVLVCWDQWYPEAARIMALRGAELLIYPTAIGWESTDTPEEQKRQLDAWMTIQRSHAVANGIPVVTVNRTGYEADPSGATGGITFWGNSFVAGQQGELLHRSPCDAEDESVISVDLGRTETVRRWWPFLRDRRIDAYSPILLRYGR